MAGPKNALAAWGVSALHAVELPSGMKALVKLPDVAKLIEKRAFPEDLREVASQFATSGIALEDLDHDGRVQVIRFTYELVAEMVKYLSTDPESWEQFKERGGPPSDYGWEPVTLTAQELREMEIDQADVTALSRIASRSSTPNTITIASRLDRGILEASNTRAEAADGGGPTSVAEFQGASGGAGRDVPRDDGGDVRPDPIRVSRDRRPGRRVRG